MLLFVGDPEDLTAAYLSWLASRRGVKWVSVDEAELGRRCSLAVADDGTVDLCIDDRAVPLQEVTGAVVRLNPRPRMVDEVNARSDGDDGDGGDDGAVDDVMGAVALPERRAGLQYALDCLPFPVANRPSCGRSNGAKPVHMRDLATAGFDVPTWITTNEADEGAGFAAACEHGAVVKAASGLRSHVRMWGDDVARAFLAGTAPHVVQEYVPGHEVRVHVVGDRTFASRIDSDATDYRFDSATTGYAATDLPDDLADRCVTFAARSGLVLAGFDFRVHEDTRTWYCLEMNPVPTFLPYEASTGQCIGDAVIDELAPGSTAAGSVSPLAARFAATQVPDD